MVDAVPEIELRGAAEYLNALDVNLVAAYNGEKTAEEAMKDAAKEQDRITRRLGKQEQKETWHFLARMYPEPIQKLAGVDKWVL